jgi:magnesium chelatase family protein
LATCGFGVSVGAQPLLQGEQWCLSPDDPRRSYKTTRMHRVAGLTGDHTAFVTTRPFRALHHTISDVGLIGGSRVPRPGDMSRAHNGILFLDELPEFRRHVLEVLPQPLEHGVF